MTAETSAPTLASVVQEARRSSGDTSASLASRVGVDVDSVRLLERGDPVPETQALAVLHGLGIDPAPHVVGTATGTVAVRPVDADHARVMAYVADVAAPVEVWLVFSDAVAVPEVEGHDPEACAAVQAEHDAWSRRNGRWSVQAGWATVAIAAAIVATLVAGMVMTDALLRDPRMLGLFDVLLVDLLLAAVATGTVALASGFLAKRRTNPHLDRLARLRLAQVLSERRRSEVAGMTRHGYVVSDRGVTVHRASEDGPSRRDHPVSSFRAVNVADEDADHVTVTVDTVIGRVTMPWLPRTADLIALTARWSARTRGTDVLEGPQ